MNISVFLLNEIKFVKKKVGRQTKTEPMRYWEIKSIVCIDMKMNLRLIHNVMIGRFFAGND